MTVIACVVDETGGYLEDEMPAPVMQGDMDWTELQPIVEQCAKRTSWKYKKYVEYDDVLQTGWLYYFENRKAIDALPRDVYGMMFVKRRIQSACNTYALREMCAKTGVQWEDQYRFSAGEVRFLVQLIFAGGLKGGENANVIAGYVDVGRALTSLSVPTQDVLWAAYGPDRADDSQLSSTDRGRAHRAIRRLQSILNGEQPSESHAEPRS